MPTVLGSPMKNIDLDVPRSLRMHRRPAIIAAAVVMVLLFGYGLTRHPYYSANSLVYVQPLKSKAITDTSEQTYDSQRYDSYLQQQFQTVVRPDVLRQALAKPATHAWRFPGESLDSATARLQHLLKIERVEQSYELSISLSGNDPVAISNVVNAVTNSYIRAERDDELAQSDQQLQILQQELDRVSTQLADDRRQQAELSVSLGMADTATPENGNPFDTGLADVRTALIKADDAHSVAVAQAASVSNDSAGLRTAADEAVASDPGLAALKQTMGQRRSVLVSQMSGLTAKNPIYQQDQEELAHLNSSLIDMENEARNHAMQQILQKYQLEVRRTADVEERLRSELAQKTSQATSATPALQRAADVAADITRLQGRYTLVSNAINSMQLERDTSGLVHVLVPATPPLAPKTSIKNLILIAAIPMGIIAGIVVALLLSRFDPRVYIPKDISRALGFFPMATMPSLKEVDKRGEDEFLLRLLAGIDQIHRTDGAKMFVFTAASAASDVPGLVGSLSRKMERLGYRVATTHVTELISNRELSSGFFKPGAIPETPAITHENFVVQKIAAMKQEADFIFVESFPILSSSEAEFAARLGDVVVLVAQSSLTTRSELLSSFSLIRRLRIPGVAIVLTELKQEDADNSFIDTVQAVKLRRYES